MQSTNVIVDTGCANLYSVKYAIERLGFSVEISDDLARISQADKVILPGVGNAKHAMANIKRKNLVETLQKLSQPVLGFCLGMQLMTESSTEGIKSLAGDLSAVDSAMSSAVNDPAEQSLSQTIPCLGLIPSQVSPLIAPGQRLPHMGWNTLTSISDHPVFEGIKVGDYFYFVHSFAAPISQYTVASCDYGSPFSAAIAKDNVIGCQFHPERSGPLGSKIIKNFLAM